MRFSYLIWPFCIYIYILCIQSYAFMTTSRCTSDQKSSMTEYVVLDRERKGSAPSTGWTVHWIGRSLLLARPRLGPPDTSAQRRRFWRCRVVSPATIFNIRQIFWFPSATLSGTMRPFKQRRTDLKGQKRSQFDLQTWHTWMCECWVWSPKMYRFEFWRLICSN